MYFSVRCSDDDAFTSEEASLFIAGLESHFYECFSVKLHVSMSFGYIESIHDRLLCLDTTTIYLILCWKSIDTGTLPNGADPYE